MPRFAAIDVGSNASRLLVVDARSPTKIIPLRAVRVPVRLGHGVFRTGRLDPQAIDACVAAMREFSQTMEELSVVGYRAVVTASARGASNADVLLDRVREETDVDLRAIDGLEEARLVTLAVTGVLPLPGHALLADLGGGSLELSELSAGEASFSVSLPVGTVRMLESLFPKSGSLDDAGRELVDEYLGRMFAPHKKRLGARPFQAVVTTGGNFEAIAKLCPAGRTKTPAIDVAAARKLLAETAHETSRERMVRYGLREDRADVLLPALCVADQLARLTRAKKLLVPGVGLKDGIVRELVQKHFRVWDYGSAEDAVVGAALQLGRRYHFDERHATQVTALATKLFDATARLHRYGAPERAMLRLAALLHDIGDFVHPSSHHKHSAYLVRHSDLMGLPPDRREIVAEVARYHRKSEPVLRHPEFRALSEDDRRKVTVLAGLLRIADALDRGHRSKVVGFEAKLRGRTLVLDVLADEDASLEAWTMRRKAELFESALDAKVELEVRAEVAPSRTAEHTVAAARATRPRAERAGRPAKPQPKAPRAKASRATPPRAKAAPSKAAASKAAASKAAPAKVQRTKTAAAKPTRRGAAAQKKQAPSPR